MENWCSDIEIKSRISHLFDLDVSAVGSFFHQFLFFQVRVTDGLRIHFYGSVVLKRDRTYVSTIISVHELWELTERLRLRTKVAEMSRFHIKHSLEGFWKITVCLVQSLRPVDHLLCSVLHHMDFVHAS